MLFLKFTVPVEWILIMENFEDENLTNSKVTANSMKFTPLENYHVSSSWLFSRV